IPASPCGGHGWALPDGEGCRSVENCLHFRAWRLAPRHPAAQPRTRARPTECWQNRAERVQRDESDCEGAERLTERRADLQHLAHRAGWDVDGALTCARTHFDAEARWPDADDRSHTWPPGSSLERGS